MLVPGDLQGEVSLSLEFFKYFYHTVHVTYELYQPKIMLYMIRAIDLEQLFESGGGIKLGYNVEYNVNLMKLDQYSNYKRCTGDLLGFIKNKDGDTTKITDLTCKYKENNQVTWATKTAFSG